MDCGKWQLGGNGDRSFACVSWVRVKYLLDGNHRINTNEAQSSWILGMTGELVQLIWPLMALRASISGSQPLSNPDAAALSAVAALTSPLYLVPSLNRVDFSALGTPTTHEPPRSGILLSRNVASLASGRNQDSKFSNSFSETLLPFRRHLITVWFGLVCISLVKAWLLITAATRPLGV